MLPPVLQRAPYDKDPPGWLDRSLPWGARILILLLMAAIPIMYVVKTARSEEGLTRLILFGKTFAGEELPEVKAMHPYLDPGDGYDGQFYAQIALDPLLHRVGISRALDTAADYRAQRIGLPAMAYVLGLGETAPILHVYALLNLAFWLVLVGALAYSMPFISARDLLCLAAILMGSGALVSIMRALTDLPSTTLGFLGTVSGEGAAMALLPLAILTRPTSALFLTRYAELPLRNGRWGEVAVKVALIMAVPVLWNMYAIHRLGLSSGTSDNIKLPFQSWVHCVPERWHAFRALPANWEWKNVTEWESKLFDFLAPLCLMAQAAYFVVYRDWECRYWRMGAAFAVLYLCFSRATFDEYIATARCALPMTLAFNLRLRKQRGKTFKWWWLAGNAGLAGALHSMLSYDHFL